VGVSGSRGRRRSRMRLGKDAKRLPIRRRPHSLTDAVGFCSAEAGSSREGAEARTGAASPALYSTRLRYYLSAASRHLHKETLHGYERRLSKIGGEMRRIRECAGSSQRVAEEAEAFVRRFFEVVAGFPPEVVAVAVLWTAAKATGAPRPLGNF